MSIDVTIYGAGIFGLSCAWALVRRGARVAVVDPAGVGAGSSGGIVGALAPHVPEQWNEKKAFQYESLVMAEAFWSDVAAVSGMDPGYARLGRLQPVLPGGRALADARGQGAKTLWQGRYHWTVEDAPTGWTPGTAQVIRDTLSARIHPARACTALAAALRAQGVDMEHDLPVQGHVLHATGWQGLTHLRDNKDRAAGNGVKGQAALLGFDAADQPQLFIDGLHIIPHADGTTAIGATSEREAMDTTTDDLLEALIQKAKTLVPAIVDAPVLQRWAGIRPRARSRAPLLGKWPRRPGHYIANGGFKIGFGVAPKVAEVMADLILEGRDTIPAPFRTDGLAPWGFGA